MYHTCLTLNCRAIKKSFSNQRCDSKHYRSCEYLTVYLNFVSARYIESIIRTEQHSIFETRDNFDHTHRIYYNRLLAILRYQVFVCSTKTVWFIFDHHGIEGYQCFVLFLFCAWPSVTTTIEISFWCNMCPLCSTYGIPREKLSDTRE